jgi:hypothetical protein
LSDPDPYAPPANPEAHGDQPLPGPRPERGGWLSAFLGLMIVAGTVVAVVNVGLADHITETHPGSPSWAPYALAAAGLINVICGVAMWSFRRWGFVGAMVISLIAAALNVLIGLHPARIALGLVGPALLAGLVIPKWRFFR